LLRDIQPGGVGRGNRADDDGGLSRRTRGTGAASAARGQGGEPDDRGGCADTMTAFWYTKTSHQDDPSSHPVQLNTEHATFWPISYRFPNFYYQET
jgi:hypothetical protein